MVGFENDDSVDLQESVNFQDLHAAFSKDIQDLEADVNDLRDELRSLYLYWNALRRSMF